MSIQTTFPQGYAGDGARWDPNSLIQPMSSVGYYNPQTPYTTSTIPLQPSVFNLPPDIFNINQQSPVLPLSSTTTYSQPTTFNIPHQALVNDPSVIPPLPKASFESSLNTILNAGNYGNYNGTPITQESLQSFNRSESFELNTSTVPSYTPAIEDVQEIILPLPLPEQLPAIRLPLRTTAAPVGPTVLNSQSQGLVINPPQGTMNGVSSQRTGTFVLPPSIINK